MNLQIEYLAQLQETDLQIRGLDREISIIPSEVQSLMDSLKEAEETWESVKKQVEAHDKERRQKERELEDTETRLEKYNSQLLSIKTNKEYTAVLHEIEQTKDGISTLEEEILGFLDKAEEAQAQLKRGKQVIEEKRRLTKEKISLIESRRSDLQAKREGLLTKRAEQEKRIEPGLMKEYNKIYKARKGIAVARAKEAACTGCNMALMPQLFEEIRTDEDRIFHCPNCHRILFYIEENPQE